MSNQYDPSSRSPVYQIRIRGHLGNQWEDWFEGVIITKDDNGDTLLTGPVADQAALYGLLKKVRDLGITLISVHYVETDKVDAVKGPIIGIKIIRKAVEILNLQKMGGIAALIHAIAYVVGIILFVNFVFPFLNADSGRYMTFVAGNQLLMHSLILITYWVSAIALVVMALALYERLKPASPSLVQIATVFGLIWAGLIIGSGNLMLHDFGVITNLHEKNPAQAATVWLALEAVENGLVSGNELVGSLWVLLLSCAALRTGGLAKPLNWLGLILSATGVLTLIPASWGTIFFGLGMIIWSVWLGIIMLRSKGNAL